MNSRKREKRGLRVYAVLDRNVIKKPVERLLGKVLKAGCSFLQVRDKRSGTKGLFELSQKVSRFLKNRKITFLINDRIDIAGAVGADGVHLGKGDFPVKLARRLLGKGAVIGKTAHTLQEALSAEKEGADYISIGPVFKTPFKKHLRPRGIRFVKTVSKKVHVPLFCIGGIKKTNMDILRGIGVDGVAMIRGLFHDAD